MKAEPQVAASAVKKQETAVEATNGVKTEESVKKEESAADGTKTTADDNEERQLARQIVFYFSDANFPFDKFLFQTSQASLSSEAQQSAPGTGWVTLTTLLSFKRMRQYQSLGLKRVAQAIRDHGAPSLEVDEAGVKVRRTQPIKQLEPGHAVARSIYAKGFPNEEEYEKENGQGSLQIALENWFSHHGNCFVLRMRRETGKPEEGSKYGPREFKGSVFCEFATKEQQEAFLALDPKPTFPKMDAPIEVQSKAGFMEMKAKEKNIDMSRDNNEKPPPRTGFNAFKQLKADKRGNSRTKDDSELAEDELFIMFGGEKVNITKEGQIEDPDNLPYLKNAVLAFSGHGSEDLDFSTIKGELSKAHPANFIQPLEDGAKEGLVGFRQPIDDAKFQEIQDLKIKIAGSSDPVTWRKLSDEEEKEFNLSRANFFAKQQIEDPYRSNGGRGSRGRGRGRGGQSRRGRGGDRRDGRDSRDSRDQRDGRDHRSGGRRNDRNEERAQRDSRDNGESVKREREDDGAKDEQPSKKTKTEE